MFKRKGSVEERRREGGEKGARDSSVKASWSVRDPLSDISEHQVTVNFAVKRDLCERRGEGGSVTTGLPASARSFIYSLPPGADAFAIRWTFRIGERLASSP
jgi:hypothetical protein